MELIYNILFRLFYILMGYIIIVFMSLIGILLIITSIVCLPFLLFVKQDVFKDIINGKIKGR